MAGFSHPEASTAIDLAIIGRMDAADLNLFPVSEGSSVTSPDFSALIEADRLSKAKQSLFPSPDQADFYLRDGALTLPDGFKEPEPFVLNSEQWETYQRRIRHIQLRHREAMAGYEYNG